MRRSVIRRKVGLKGSKQGVKRTHPPKRKALPKVNRARKAREFARCYGGKARRDFVVALPCVVCGGIPSDPAHIQGGGAGRKGDADKIIPLCRRHHDEQHDGGILTFARKYDLDLPALAAETQRAWLTTQRQEAA